MTRDKLLLSLSIAWTAILAGAFLYVALAL